MIFHGFLHPPQTTGVRRKLFKAAKVRLEKDLFCRLSGDGITYLLLGSNQRSACCSANASRFLAARH